MWKSGASAPRQDGPYQGATSVAPASSNNAAGFQLLGGMSQTNAEILLSPTAEMPIPANTKKPVLLKR
jgi:hypothetical protein